MVTQPTNNSSAADPVAALAEHMECLSRIFGAQLPDSSFLTQNEGAFDNQIVFIVHPNGDVQAHQWAAQSYQWVNLGQYSYRRKRIEGQLEKEKLRGQKIGGGLPPNTVHYFLAVTKQREQDCKNSSAYVPQISFQSFVTSSLSQPEMRYRLRHVDTSREHHTSLSSAGSSTLTALPTTKATTVMAAAGTAPRRYPLMSKNPFIDDPFVARPVNNQAEYNEYALSPTPADTGLRPFTQCESASDHNQGKVDKGKSVATAEQVDHLLADPFMTHRTHGPSSAIEDASVLEDHKFLTTKPIQEQEATEKRAYNLDKERMSSGPLAQQCQPASNAFQMTLLDNEVSHLEPESHKLTRQYAVSDTAAHHGPAVNLTTKHSRQIDTPENAALGQSEPLSIRRVLRESEVEAAWRDGQDSIFRKGAATSNMSNEELELYSKPSPQNWNGPFFPDSAPKASDLLTPGFMVNKRCGQEELAGWWHSGNMRERQEDYLKVLQKTAAARVMPQGEWSNDWSLDHALYPVFENLKAYVEKGSHKPCDYFARFAKPPEWCIDNSPAGRESFFGEDYGTPPARLGRYVTKPAVASTPCASSFNICQAREDPLDEYYARDDFLFEGS
jgi:hypothetical protein